MNIKDFKRFRAGSGFPACVDVEMLTDYHESDGLILTTYISEAEGNTIQIRKKGNEVFIINYRHKDKVPLPDFYKDTEIIWTNKKGGD